MSLRLRLTLLVVALVLGTTLLAWLVAGRAVVQPFAREVFDAYVDQAVEIAGRVQKGENPDRIGEKLGLHVRRVPHPPREGGERRCRRLFRREHEVLVCGGRRTPVAVSTTEGWILIRRDIDFERPSRRIGDFLLLVALGATGLAIYLARVTTRPLETTKAALERVTAGDLGHQLPMAGPRELRELAGTFNGMTRRVRAMLEAERSLMAGISHELRTPLARLRLALELIRDLPPDSKRIDAMERDLEEMDRLIGELLESSRLAIGERHLERTENSTRALCELAARRANLAGHEVRIDGEGAVVLADEERMVRVLTNLLENAAKYAPGEPTIEVALAGRTIAVRDRGPGVAAESLPRLFEPFFRAGQRAPGLGLGLMIARQIVELHGGTIVAENRPGGGLEVKIDLGGAPSPA